MYTHTLCLLQTICVSEMLCRAAKRLYKTYMQGVEAMSLSAAISHFLNCLLSACPTPHAAVAADEVCVTRNQSLTQVAKLGSLL